ncbi:hypothetical protein JTB14_031764 [Gonioctena quinquepunctata]|nr:hypothetical protein JTB14_031764 [Gonioctena quinquepunctata]
MKELGREVIASIYRENLKMGDKNISLECWFAQKNLSTILPKAFYSLDRKEVNHQQLKSQCRKQKDSDAPITTAK